MQATSSSLLSLSLSHSDKRTSQNVYHHEEAAHVDVSNVSPPSPPPKASARKTKRHSNVATKSQKAAQLAKKELRSKLREDWTWPLSPDTRQVSNLPTDDSAWQERGDGFGTDSSPGELSIDPYQYENPNAVTAPAGATQSTESKKRKRQQLLMEEMGWNEGLRLFMERRNAWSGARDRQPDPVTTTRSETTNSGRCGGNAFGERNVSSRRHAIYASPDAMKSFRAEPYERTATSLSYQPLPDLSPSVTLVPLAPTILPPKNAVRACITPATYPSIYSKIVIQGLTPTVPINLHDVVGALVKGWKDNDEWPPKTDAEKAVKVEGSGGLEGPGALISNEVKKGVRKRMGKVKRALHLSGTAERNDDRTGDLSVDEAPDDIR